MMMMTMTMTLKVRGRGSVSVSECVTRHNTSNSTLERRSEEIRGVLLRSSHHSLGSLAWWVVI